MALIGSTKRQDVNAGLQSVMESIKAAQPTLLRVTYSDRPGSFPEVPCAYVGSMDETLTHVAGIRTRNFTPTVVIVDNLIDNEQTGSRMDILVDLFVDYFTDSPAIVPGAQLQMTAVTDGELDVIGSELTIHYRSVTLTFGQFSFQEGIQ